MRGSEQRPDTARWENQFLQWLPEIEKLIEISCRKRGLRSEESEDFGSWAKIRFIENNYRRVRKFEGRSQRRTYLAVVVQNLLRDYLDHIWGRWRPSATAKRLGAKAVELERKIHRDGSSAAEAVRFLVQASAEPEKTKIELEKLLARLPIRETHHTVGLDEVAEVSDKSSAESGVRDRELHQQMERVRTAMNAGLQQLEPEDRLLIRQRFAHGLTVTEIAAGMGVDRRKLYRQFEGCLRRLRTTMEASGVAAQDVSALVGWVGVDSDLDVTGLDEALTMPTLQAVENAP